MLFDIGLVISCHFITQNLVLLGKDKPGGYAVATRTGATIWGCLRSAISFLRSSQAWQDKETE